MHKIKQWLLACLALFLSTGVMGETGYGVLDRFFSDVKGFEADFTQTVFDENFREIQKSSGHMALVRPGLFRWVYASPYEQLIVGDGQEIWIYDVDLEQVTVKSQSDALDETPAQLLSSGKPIVDHFSVVELGMRDDLLWFELTPLEAENAFMAIRLGFDGQIMKKMELEDSLGNRTLFVFSKVRVNPKFAKDAFIFSPPQGVDVIGRD